jgi:ABC-type uncharacterized transport system substrate-binding protein
VTHLLVPRSVKAIRLSPAVHPHAFIKMELTIVGSIIWVPLEITGLG